MTNQPYNSREVAGSGGMSQDSPSPYSYTFTPGGTKLPARDNPAYPLLGMVGYHPSYWGKLIMLMMQAYADESGNEDFLVLAGYAMPFDLWLPFAEDWQTMLRMQPAINALHMYELEQGKNEFFGMRPEFKKLKVRDALAVIEKHKPMGLCAHIKMNDWKELAKPFARKGFRNAYYPLFSCITTLLFQHNIVERIEARVDFVFDEQVRLKENAIDMYERVKGMFKAAPELHRLFGGTPIFKDDKEVLPLQAADMLAWYKRKKLDFPTERNEICERLDRTIYLEQELDREYLLSLLN